MPQTKTRILLTDDHPVMRKGLSLLIQHEPDMMVCAEAEDADGALRAVAEQKPDLAVVDISLKNSSGLELIKELHRRAPQMPVLVLSIHDENLYAERALQAGARGYVMKQEATECVLDAIRVVARGELYLTEHAQSRLLRHAGRDRGGGKALVATLSNRELEVFELVGRGQNTRAMAEQLDISVKTVESHVARIKEKLDLKNHTELLQQATLWLSEEQRL